MLGGEKKVLGRTKLERVNLIGKIKLWSFVRRIRLMEISKTNTILGSSSFHSERSEWGLEKS